MAKTTVNKKEIEIMYSAYRLNKDEFETSAIKIKGWVEELKAGEMSGGIGDQINEAIEQVENFLKNNALFLQAMADTFSKKLGNIDTLEKHYLADKAAADAERLAKKKHN